MKLIRKNTITDNLGAFTRASTKTYVDYDGVLKTAAIDEPAYDFSGGVFNGLLIEGEATNLFSYSNDFNNAAWAKANLTAVQDVVGPDGVANSGWTITATGTGVLYRASGVTGVYGYSIHAKAGVNSWLRLMAGTSVWFNLATGTLGTQQAGVTGKIELIGNGWYKCSILAAATVPAYNISAYPVAANAVTSVVGNSILVSDTQWEAGAITSYIPTTTAAVTRAADVNGTTMLSNVPETEYTAWSGITAYVIGNKCIRLHKIYSCLVNNTNYAPESNSTGAAPKWLDEGYDNTWKMFDEVVGSQTSQATKISVAIKAGRFDSLGLLDLDVDHIYATLHDPIEGLVFREHIDVANKTYTAPSDSYLFAPIILQKNVILAGIGQYPNATLSLVLVKAGMALIGTMIVGAQRDLGMTLQNPTIDIKDFSKKDVGALGDFSVLERAFSKRMNCELQLSSSKMDSLYRLLARHRASLDVWIGADDKFSAMILYGFYRNFRLSLPLPNDARCTLEVEGLS